MQHWRVSIKNHSQDRFISVILAFRRSQAISPELRPCVHISTSQLCLILPQWMLDIPWRHVAGTAPASVSKKSSRVLAVYARSTAVLWLFGPSYLIFDTLYLFPSLNTRRAPCRFPSRYSFPALNPISRRCYLRLNNPRAAISDLSRLTVGPKAVGPRLLRLPRMTSCACRILRHPCESGSGHSLMILGSF